MKERPSDDHLARMLRNGAQGIGAACSEFCISSDNCSCSSEQQEMYDAAEFLDSGTPEEKQHREDLAVVGAVRGFPIFRDEAGGKRYFDAWARLAGDAP